MIDDSDPLGALTEPILATKMSANPGAERYEQLKATQRQTDTGLTLAEG